MAWWFTYNNLFYLLCIAKNTLDFASDEFRWRRTLGWGCNGRQAILSWVRKCQQTSLTSSLLQLVTRFAVTIFTYHKNGGKLPITKGKPNNYHLPIYKKSVYQQRFFTLKLNSQWWHLDEKMTHSSNFQNYWKKFPPQKIMVYVFNPVNYQ